MSFRGWKERLINNIPSIGIYLIILVLVLCVYNFDVYIEHIKLFKGVIICFCIGILFFTIKN